MYFRGRAQLSILVVPRRPRQSPLNGQEYGGAQQSLLQHDALRAVHLQQTQLDDGLVTFAHGDMCRLRTRVTASTSIVDVSISHLRLIIYLRTSTAELS